MTFVISIFLITLPATSATFQGGVSEQGTGSSSRIVDRNTGLGIEGAKVSIPKHQYTTQTDSHGYFELIPLPSFNFTDPNKHFNFTGFIFYINKSQILMYHKRIN